MKRIVIAIAFSLAACAGSALGQTDGRALYLAKCSTCHARDGSGNSTVGRSLGLTDIRPTIKNLTDEQLRQLILGGRGKMPANRKLDDEKLAGVTLYLRDLVAGNPDAGRAVSQVQSEPLADPAGVYQTKCSACHGRDGTGRTTAGRNLNVPDLTSAAVQGKGDADLAEVVGEGRGRMPAYAKKYNPTQVGQFVAYIRAFTESAGAKEPAASPRPPAPAPQPPPAVPPRMTAQPRSVAPAPTPAGNTAPKTAPEAEERKAAEPKPTTVRPAAKAPRSGREMYISKCSACHMRDGSGAGAIGRSMQIPSLTSPDVQAQSDENLASVISNGAGKMPAYKKKYSSAEIQLLVAYVRELARK